ncbi:MAG TPA: hypothetical protein VLB00_16085 [Gemmatimonadales bacterium]|nr:hypothetical protein [Gemmatimonadales bacterium]
MNIPELGPLLGTLVEPPDHAGEEAALDPTRLAMVDAVFARAAQARRHLAQGEEEAARAALGGSAWLEVWDAASARSAATLIERTVRRMREAAAYSRFPARRLATQLPSAEDRAVLAARLNAAGMGLEAAAPALDARGEEWDQAARRAAGELEQAWQRLIRAAQDEMSIWDRRIQDIQSWRRPWLPLIIGGSLALGLGAWLGLMLGGYLPVPGLLRPLAEWVWSLPWP